MSETSTPSGTSPQSPPRLGDERGAIMVLGIFMCAVMVSVLWYFAGIGDAVVYRERLQEAADATAYSTAVLHARGMNLIVMINLIMAMVLAIRVALKVLQIVLGIITVAVDACALLVFSPVTAAVCEAAAVVLHPADEAIEEAIENTRGPINDLLEALHDVEELIHDVVPLAAVAGGFEVGRKYNPPVDLATATPNVDAITLPTENGTTNRLCIEAALAIKELVTDLVTMLVGRGLGTVAGWISDPLVSMAMASPGYFCELGGGGGPPDVSNLLNKNASDKCDSDLQLKQHTFDDANQKWHQKCDALRVSCIDPIFDEFGTKGSSQMEDLTLRKDVAANDKSDLTQRQGARDRAEADLDSFNKGQCINNTKQQLQQKLKQIPPPQNASGSGKEPMKVSSKWQNGDPLGQIVAVSHGNGSMLNRGPKGVKVGAWNDRRARARITPPIDANDAYAQAEFFYDCAGKWKDNACNGGGDNHTPHDNEEAMWHFWWRARLRRYSAPVATVDVLILAAVGRQGLELAGAAVNGSLPPRGAAAKFLNGRLRLELAGRRPNNFELH
jgi:hypothetical protein